MYRYEIQKLIKDKKFILFSLITLLVPQLDLLYSWYSQSHSGYDEAKYTLHPAMASFLAGATIGHYGQMILVWFLPIILLGLYSDRVIYDSKSKYLVANMIRTNKKQYFTTKLVLSFIIPFLLILVSLFLNFIFANLIFHGGESFQGLEEQKKYLSVYFVNQINHPQSTMTYYIVIFSVLAGIYSMVCQAIAQLGLNMYVVYPVAFGIWFIQLISPYNITYVLQPFIEYGPKWSIPAATVFLISSLVICVGCIGWRLKADVEI